MSPPLPRDLDPAATARILTRLRDAGYGDLTLDETCRIVAAGPSPPAISWW